MSFSTVPRLRLPSLHLLRDHVGRCPFQTAAAYSLGSLVLSFLLTLRTPTSFPGPFVSIRYYSPPYPPTTCPLSSVASKSVATTIMRMITADACVDHVSRRSVSLVPSPPSLLPLIFLDLFPPPPVPDAPPRSHSQPAAPPAPAGTAFIAPLAGVA